MYWKCQRYDLCFRMRSRCNTQFNPLVFFFFFLVKDVKESVLFLKMGKKKKTGMGCCSACWCAKQRRCLQNTSCESA